MTVPRALWTLVKEAARHVLRRPVVGVVAAARTPEGDWVLIRRGDTGEWALPGGTLEWGESLRAGLERELREEAGVRVLSFGELSAVYSKPARDPRFHAVTVVVRAVVSAPEVPPVNPLEIREVRCFRDSELPRTLSMTMREMLDQTRRSDPFWE